MAFPYPYHPLFVHFPVALFLMSLVFEVVSRVFRHDRLHHAAFYMFIAATLITPWTVRTGEMQAHALNLHHPVLESHERFAELTLWLSVIAWPVVYFLSARHPRAARWVFLGALVALAVTVSLAAHFGGRMVYEYGVGVSL